MVIFPKGHHLFKTLEYRLMHRDGSWWKPATALQFCTLAIFLCYVIVILGHGEWERLCSQQNAKGLGPFTWSLSKAILAVSEIGWMCLWRTQREVKGILSHRIINGWVRASHFISAAFCAPCWRQWNLFCVLRVGYFYQLRLNQFLLSVFYVLTCTKRTRLQQEMRKSSSFFLLIAARLRVLRVGVTKKIAQMSGA